MKGGLENHTYAKKWEYHGRREGDKCGNRLPWRKPTLHKDL